MHILLHLAAFVLAMVWVIGFFLYHLSGAIHIVLVLALVAFVMAIYKRPGKRTTV